MVILFPPPCESLVHTDGSLHDGSRVHPDGLQAELEGVEKLAVENDVHGRAQGICRKKIWAAFPSSISPWSYRKDTHPSSQGVNPTDKLLIT